MITVRESCRSVKEKEAVMRLELSGIKRVSHIGESRELGSLVTLMGVAKLSKMAKPASVVKKRIRAATELSGVMRDSAHGKDGRGTREALLPGTAEGGINNLEVWQKRVGKARISEEAEQCLVSKGALLRVSRK